MGLAQLYRTSDRLWANEAHGIHDSWESLRQQFITRVRVTGRFTRKDGKTLHVRRATTAEPAQQRIHAALGIDPSPGGISKTVI